MRNCVKANTVKQSENNVSFFLINSPFLWYLEFCLFAQTLSFHAGIKTQRDKSQEKITKSEVTVFNMHLDVW